MNIFNFIIDFFSNERLQRILNNYSLNSLGTNRELMIRLVKYENFDVNALIKFFYKQELKNLCIVYGQKNPGNKNELWNILVQEVDSSVKNFHEIDIDNENLSKEKEEIKNILNLLEEQFYVDVGRFAHNVVNHSKYSRDIAILKIKKLYPTKTIEAIGEAYDYVDNVYTEVFALVKTHIGEYDDEYNNKGKSRSKDGFFYFERELHEKYPKIPKQDLLGMISFNFLWYYLK
jgi:hypothetical protein